MRPIFPSCIRSEKFNPFPVYRFAMLITNRRLASIRAFFASCTSLSSSVRTPITFFSSTDFIPNFVSLLDISFFQSLLLFIKGGTHAFFLGFFAIFLQINLSFLIESAYLLNNLEESFLFCYKVFFCFSFKVLDNFSKGGFSVHYHIP